MINFTSNTPIDINHARSIAPAVFSDEQDKNMSAKYVQIPTYKVVEQMQKEGFNMYSIQQARPSRRSINTAKHLIRFRHDSVKPFQTETGDEFFEIILVNSHNGSSGINFLTGIFRLVCSNGLMVSKMNVDVASYRHSGISIDDIIEASYRVISNHNRVKEIKAEWQGVMLTKHQRYELATDAIKIKYGDSWSPFKAEDFLTVHRNEDVKYDLWSTFNVIQENLINGGMSTVNSRNRRITTRGIKNIGQNIKFNQDLWESASKYLTIDI